MKDIKRCKCGNIFPKIKRCIYTTSTYVVHCKKCDNRGGRFSNKDSAVIDWNVQSMREEGQK